MFFYLLLARLTFYIYWLLIFVKCMSFVFSHRTVIMVYKRVCRNIALFQVALQSTSSGLANHLEDVYKSYTLRPLTAKTVFTRGETAT